MFVLIGCTTGLSEAEVDQRVSAALVGFQAGLPQPLPTATPVTFPPTATATTLPPTTTPMVDDLPAPVTPRDLIVDSLTLVDADGDTRIKLAMVEDSPTLSFVDDEGGDRIRISSSEIYQRIAMIDNTGISRMSLSTLFSSPTISMRDETQDIASQMFLEVIDGEPMIGFADGDFQVRLELGLRADGVPNLILTDASGSRTVSLGENLNGGGAGVTLWRTSTEEAASFSVLSDGRPVLGLSDQFGNIRALLGVFPSGEAQLQILDFEGDLEGIVP